VAKVTISIPDELLARLDERARSIGTTRSGLLRTLAERGLAADDDVRRRDLERTLRHAAPHRGDGARAVGEHRTAT
jgi:metal-responsive CopG/Arc/MetJ family transcriptional regulator